MPVQKVGVVGCGLMGSGIAEVCARNKYPTLVREVNDQVLNAGLARIRASLEKGVAKGKLTAEERDAALANIRGTAAFSDFKDCDLVIEAVIENPEEKKRVFAELDRACKPAAILASNTSSISITTLAAATKRPGQCIGLHFFNPVPVMKLIEIVRPEVSSPETYAAARAFSESLGKVTVTAKDTPGFIVNLLLVPYLCEAVRAVEGGLATPEDIDTAMKLGCNMPMGPLELLDFVGLDTTLYIIDVMFDEFHDPRFAAPTLLRRMVAAGRNGRKAGRGFYDYSKK